MGKWLSGIIAPVITAVLIWWLTIGIHNPKQTTEVPSNTNTIQPGSLPSVVEQNDIPAIDKRKRTMLSATNKSNKSNSQALDNELPQTNSRFTGEWTVYHNKINLGWDEVSGKTEYWRIRFNNDPSDLMIYKLIMDKYGEYNPKRVELKEVDFNGKILKFLTMEEYVFLGYGEIHTNYSLYLSSNDKINGRYESKYISDNPNAIFIKGKVEEYGKIVMTRIRK